VRTQTYTYECPSCGADIECLVDIGEHLVDFPETCACGHVIDATEQAAYYSKAIASCWGSAIERPRPNERQLINL